MALGKLGLLCTVHTRGSGAPTNRTMCPAYKFWDHVWSWETQEQFIGHLEKGKHFRYNSCLLYLDFWFCFSVCFSLFPFPFCYCHYWGAHTLWLQCMRGHLVVVPGNCGITPDSMTDSANDIAFDLWDGARV